MILALSCLLQIAAQSTDSAIRDYSSLPAGMVTLAGVLALGFNAWLQGGIKTAPQVISATRYSLSRMAISGLKVIMSHHGMTGLSLWSFDHRQLGAFVLDTAQRGFFHVSCYGLLGQKSVQEHELVMDKTEKEVKELPSLCSGCQFSSTCANVVGIGNITLPPTIRCDLINPEPASAAAIEDMSGKLFLINGCIFPLHSLINLPLRFWVERGVIGERECAELMSINVGRPIECFYSLRKWFGGVDIWDWIETAIESNDSSYMVASSLHLSITFPFEEHDRTIPWPPVRGSTCHDCASLARADGAYATLAMVKVAIWFCQYAFYHEALYSNGIVMSGAKNAPAADLFLEIVDNRSRPKRGTNAAILKDISRKGTYIEEPTYSRLLQHAASAGEIVFALVLSMVADPGIWITATLARQTTSRVLASQSGHGFPMGQRWRWSCTGRLTPLNVSFSQGLAVWDYMPHNALITTLYGWLVVAAAVVGTRLRKQAGQLDWCTNFGIPSWVGWVAYGAVSFVCLISFGLSFLGPSKSQDPDRELSLRFDMQGRAGPLAAEATLELKKFTLWRVARLTGLFAAMAIGPLAILYPAKNWLGYLLEVISMLLWFAAEEYTLKDGYTGSAASIALLTSGLGGICRSRGLQIPRNCLVYTGN
jgi:hypothetical protein